MNIVDLGKNIGRAVGIGALLGTGAAAGSPSSGVEAGQTTIPACFSDVEVFRDLPPELSHYYSLKPGEVVESPFALSHAPGPGESVPVRRFRDRTECLVFVWTGNPGGAGGMETRIWDEGWHEWKRIRVNPLQGGATNYDTKGPKSRGRS